MTAIPYTHFPQLCKGVSKVCVMKVSETMKLQESLSRQVQGIYAGFTMSLKWLKPLTSHTEISDIFFLNIWALSSISAFYCNTSTRETRLMQMLCQGFQSHLYWSTTLNNTTVTVRHRRTKAFFWGRWFAVGLDQGVEELEPSEGFLPSSIQSVSSSETYQWLMTALRRALHQPLLELIFLLLLGIRHHSWWSV